MPDLSKANTTEVDGDKTVEYDAAGNRHIRFKCDTGNMMTKGSPLGGPDTVQPEVRFGVHLVCSPKFKDGQWSHGTTGRIVGKVKILLEQCHELVCMIGDMRAEFVFPTVSARKDVAEQLRTILGAEG